MFDTEVADVRTLVDPRGNKRAIIKFPEDIEAEDIAMRVGIF
jgi:ribosomal protein L23